MEEFVLIFRHPPESEVHLLTPEQAKERLAQWENWFGGIAAQGRYIPGKRLGATGKVLKTSGLITDGPFIEIKELLAGFICVRANNMDEAVTLAHGCPIFNQGGDVEIRPVENINFKAEDWIK
jgi:hypothetical protein